MIGLVIYCASIYYTITISSMSLVSASGTGPRVNFGLAPPADQVPQEGECYATKNLTTGGCGPSNCDRICGKNAVGHTFCPNACTKNNYCRCLSGYVYRDQTRKCCVLPQDCVTTEEEEESVLTTLLPADTTSTPLPPPVDDTSSTTAPLTTPTQPPPTTVLVNTTQVTISLKAHSSNP